MPPVSRYLILCEREIHVTEWGKPSAPALVLWHGLARTGRDFDDLAAALADRYFILAPDTIGRGLSQWSPAPVKEYCLSFYVEVAQALIARYGFDKLRWLGTSMGGAIGIKAAAGSLQGRITHLVINDIGPQLAKTAIERILAYVGAPPAFARMSEFETYIRTVYKPYGYASEAQWRRMAESSARRLPDGRITAHYDPDIVQQFVHHPQDYDQWPAYERVTAKTLLLRGKESDLLQAEWAAGMTGRGPKARLIVFAGCGHAPALNSPQQIAPVADFLAEENASAV